MTERVLDVSTLAPCEPLERTLEALAGLERGERLCLLHRREPHLLYPLLEEQGFAWETHAGGHSAFEIRIWRRGDEAAAPR